MTKKKTNPNPNPETRFDGSRSNRKTTGGNSKRITKSKLRILEEQLLEMKDKALENIKKQIEGQAIDTEQASASKWLVNSLVTVSKAANAEEISYNKLKFEVKDSLEAGEQTPEQIKSEMKPRLSLVYKEPDEDEDE
jgi:phage gp46-like protein